MNTTSYASRPRCSWRLAAACLACLVFAGCSAQGRIESRYERVVADYEAGEMDAVYEAIEPETRKLLDRTNQSLANQPEYEGLEGARLFAAMWGPERRPAGTYPLGLFAPGAVTEVELQGDDKEVARLTVADRYTFWMVEHEGKWCLSASSLVKQRLNPEE